VTISYDINDSSDGSGKDRGDKEDAAQDKDEAAPEKQEVNEHARKHGRVHIGSQMVEWSVISQAREMASYMLLNKPLFKARKMSISIRLHWKCQGSAFAHHLTQLVGAPTVAPVEQGEGGGSGGGGARHRA
jgi:hypothetical protein